MKINYIELLKKSDNRWSLSFMEANKQIPFDIQRVYYIFDINDLDTQRWDHAHHETEQVLFCIQWSVTIGFDNGKEKREFILDKPNIWVYIPPMMWHYMKNFSPGALLLVIASKPYNEADYIRNYEDFITILQ